MPFVNKPAILARAIAIIVLVSLLIVAVTAFIERNTFDRLDDLNGPTEVSHISDQGRSDWNRFASGEPSRLAILLTDKDSAWLGLAHGLKSIGVPFTITDDVAEATRHNVVLVQGITEIGCMAHARRKFFDLHAANKSQLAEQALHAMGGLYEIERQARNMSDEDRWRIRQEKASPILDALHDWMLAQRDLVPNGSATAKALDYSLKRWVALTRYLEDGAVPIDNNQVENQIRPWALGRSNWLFAGSLRSGKRAAAIMSLIQSARMNGHDPYAYLKDVLTRLPTQRASEIGQLLPHQWVPA